MRVRRLGLLLALAAGSAAAQGTLVDAARSDDHDAAVALLAERADPNQAEADGTTPLHWAVHHDDADLVVRLLEAGANVAATNDYGATPMSEAAVAANVAVLEALLDAGADVDSANADGQTALMVVARSGNTAAAELLIERGANVNAREQRKGQTALMWAVAQSHPAMVKLLLERGAEVDSRSTVNEWERMVTAEPRQKNLYSGGFTPLLYAARQGCLACAELLLDAGAKVDLTDPDGVTPLLSAILNAHWDTARLLLARGANVNKWDYWGRTPLYLAVDFNTVPHGGRPDRPSLDDTTSLDMIDLLLAAGANPNAQLKLFPPYRSLRMDRGADAILDIGTTPLLRAARGADLAAIERLTTRGALVDLPQRDGITPLMAGVGAGARPIDTRGKFRTELEALATAEALLDAGAAIEARDARGRSALHYAASVGYTDVVELLVERGADVRAVDADGLTPLDAANGKLRGGRGPGTAYPGTVEALEGLLARIAPQ
ncbi:MAG TPA: ankyrin repeat domain-containing protein [Gammaproteobacteria bacterium]